MENLETTGRVLAQRQRRPWISIPKQVGDLGEDGAIGALQRRGQKQQVIDAATALEAVVVSQKRHGSGIDTVGQQKIVPDRHRQGVVLQDVAEQKPLGELVGRPRPEDLDVEHFRVADRVDEAAGDGIDLC